jgi:hypothetical protein
MRIRENKKLLKNTILTEIQRETVFLCNVLAKLNKRERMFDVPGRHTFFLAVDSAFQVKPKQKRYLFPFSLIVSKTLLVSSICTLRRSYIALLECILLFST